MRFSVHIPRTSWRFKSTTYGDNLSFESSILFTSKVIPGRDDHVSDIAETSAHSFWLLYRKYSAYQSNAIEETSTLGNPPVFV
jgi:hypothetical protein